MHKLFVSALIAGQLVQAGSATAGPPLRLPPSSPWTVDFADDSCRLIRKFGEGRREVTLIMEQFEPSEWFALTAAGDPLERDNSRDPAMQVVIRFGPSEEKEERAAFAGRLGGKPAVLISSSLRLAPLTPMERAARERAVNDGRKYNPAPISEARERNIGWLEISKGTKADLVLVTGRMDQAMRVLRACTWDLVGSWGLDIEQQKQRSRLPIPKTPSSQWFRHEDYPEAMISEGRQAIVNYRVIIDETGKVISCHIQASTRPKAFDDLVCTSIRRRALFEPALDASGKPIRSFYRQQVTYRLE